MSESRVTAVTMTTASINQRPARNITSGVRSMAALAQAGFAAGKLTLSRVGVWAGDTAQQFGVLVAVLMGPAVFSAYAFAAWALAANLGWTDSFIFTTGALSNWIIWMGMAILVNTAAAILKKHTQAD